MNYDNFEKIQFQLQKFGNVQSLMTYFTEDAFVEAHHRMGNNKSPGKDAVTKALYNSNLKINLMTVIEKLKKHKYSPKPNVKIYIPKSNGKFRSLGIPCYEDKLVQSIIADILSCIYEPIFSDSSYGYRQNRNCHMALKSLYNCISAGKLQCILKSDIKGFFDNIDQDILIKYLQETIKDKHFISLINKMIKAGNLHKGRFCRTTSGTPQGSSLSPILGNIYLHYALDSWFEENVSTIFPGSELIRYCDDFIICCRNRYAGKQILQLVNDRLAEFNLYLNPDKTNLFSSNTNPNKTVSFRFLGFNINPIINAPKIVTFMGKVDIVQTHITDILASTKTKDFKLTVMKINCYLQGLYNYYAIPTNMEFVHYIYNLCIDTIYSFLTAPNCNGSLSRSDIDALLKEHSIALPPDEPIIYF